MTCRLLPLQCLGMTNSGAHPSFAGTDELRSNRRFKIELPVIVNTALSDQAGWITDISKKGLRLHGIDAPIRARICINYKGKFVEGTVRWSTPHRGIGVALDLLVQEGPLAQIWQRFNNNIAAFGSQTRMTKPTFGRKV
jgi:hypothetical protein